MYLKTKPLIFCLVLMFWAAFLVQIGLGIDYYYKQNDIVDIKVPCIQNNTQCDPLVYCNISVTNPKSDLIINNQAMNKTNVYYNYTLNDSSIVGQYYAVVTCGDGVNNGFGSITFEINNVGYQVPEITNIGVIVFLPMFITVLFFVFAWLLDSNKFWLIKILLMLLGFIFVFVSFGFALQLVVQYYSFNAIQDSISFTWWVYVAIFVVLMLLFLIYFVIHILDYKKYQMKNRTGNYD